MWSRQELKTHAKSILKLSYWKVVLVSLILGFISGGSSSGSSSASLRQWNNNNGNNTNYYDLFGNLEMVGIFIVTFLTVFIFVFVISLALSFFVFCPIEVGCQRFLVGSLKRPTNLNELSFAFTNSYMNVVKTQFLRGIFTFLWSLLFVIPGIIKSYEYRMIPYILAENPSIDSKEAFARSKAMMDGDKWNAFVLDLSFIGWHILGFFTCFILNIFYVNPYYHLTCAELYEVLKQKVDGNANPYSTQY